MESYLQGQDLWEVIGGIKTIPPVRENTKVLRRWRIEAGKAMFALEITVKSLCYEISKLDSESRISETRMRCIIIKGLRPEYNGFMTAIRGWHTQPILLELESLLAN
ncbi:hypothetical protein AMTRI_Chr04g183600 [Amborella trichopoda]